MKGTKQDLSLAGTSGEREIFQESLIDIIYLSSELQTGAEPAGWQELRAVRRWTAALPWIGDCQSGGCFLPAPPCAQLQVLVVK